MNQNETDTVSVLENCGLDGEEVDLHVLEYAAVLLKAEMTAPELLTAAESLQLLSASLLAHLAVVCGRCADCGRDCPGDDLENPDSVLHTLPPELLDTFVAADVCLDALEKHLLLEDIVYDGR